MTVDQHLPLWVLLLWEKEGAGMCTLELEAHIEMWSCWFKLEGLSGWQWTKNADPILQWSTEMMEIYSSSSFVCFILELEMHIGLT